MPNMVGTSRIGRQPIPIPEGATVKIDGSEVVVSGAKGEVERTFNSQMEVKVVDNCLQVKPRVLNQKTQAIWGTTRALLANMIEGVIKGFGKTLKLVGTGYRVKMEGEKLVMLLGYSHPVVFAPVEGVKLQTPDEETIRVEGADKAKVSQVAAKIRSLRPPEPYKGKGIRYENEEVKKKPGKAGKTGVGTYGPPGGKT